MKLYFSGLASKSERDMLIEAGVDDYLADLKDSVNIPGAYNGSYALDSGAYRAWKAGAPIEPSAWLESLQKWYKDTLLGTPDFIVMPDVLGDWQATWERWQQMKHCQDRLVAVWQWGAPIEHLESMVSECVLPYQIVCVGGLVPYMRDKNEQVLAEVKAIAADYGEHLHILGLNWLKAMEELDDLVPSCDTSKWIDGGRYGAVIYQDPDTGTLVESHKLSHPEYNNATREDLCIACARNLNERFNHRMKVQAVEKKYARTYVLDSSKVFTPRSQLHGEQVAASNVWMSHRFNQESEKRKELAAARNEGRSYKH